MVLVGCNIETLWVIAHSTFNKQNFLGRPNPGVVTLAVELP